MLTLVADFFINRERNNGFLFISFSLDLKRTEGEQRAAEPKFTSLSPQ